VRRWRDSAGRLWILGAGVLLEKVGDQISKFTIRTVPPNARVDRARSRRVTD
jgi:hypothetical protein